MVAFTRHLIDQTFLLFLYLILYFHKCPFQGDCTCEDSMGVEWGADRFFSASRLLHGHMGCMGTSVVVEWVKVVDEVLWVGLTES